MENGMSSQIRNLFKVNCRYSNIRTLISCYWSTLIISFEYGCLFRVTERLRIVRHYAIRKRNINIWHL